jgi:hypothetical protein
VVIGLTVACAGCAAFYAACSSHVEDWDQQRLRGADLHRKLYAAQGRLYGRLVVCTWLGEGRLTLVEAAAWFREIESRLPLQTALPGLVPPAPGDSEAWCRQVIDYVDVLFPQGREADEPPVRQALEALRARLRAEQQTRKEACGTITLPDISPDVALPGLDLVPLQPFAGGEL